MTCLPPGRESRRRQQRLKRVRYLGSNALGQILFLGVVTIFALALLGHALSATLMLCWLGTLILIGLIQWHLGRRICRASLDDQAIHGTGELLIACMLGTGFAWGVVGLHIVLQNVLADQVVTVVLITCLVVYALTHTSAVFGGFITYTLVLVGPAAVYLLMTPEAQSRTLGAGLIIVAAACLVSAWRHYELLCRMVKLEVESGEMTGVLKKLQATIEANQESESP